MSKLRVLVSLAVGFAVQSNLVHAQTVFGPTDTLTISNIIAKPDGFSRPVIAVNGQYPSPLIRANKGENFRINVVNNLADPTMLRQTSIHWHGVFQHRSAWADGPDGVTQCPIAQSGESFEYRFNAGAETGTYWYHSHFGTQYCDGLRGPIVIYDANDPHRDLYDVDNENTVITLADWYHLQSPSIRGAALSQATLINGKGRQPNGDSEAPLAIVNVEKGRRYRLRIVSMSCDPDYTFSIDGHELKIIEADGQLTEPLTVTRLKIFAGQRYSVVVHANQDIGNYWIRSIPNIGAAGLPNFGKTDNTGINSAVLRYASAPPDEPTSTAPPESQYTDLNEAELHALLNPAAPGGSGAPDVHVDFKMSFSGGRFNMNPGESWTSPDKPVMVQIMNGVDPSALLPASSIHTLPPNAVVEVSIPGLAIAGSHPFHLHGHAFSVIRSAGSSATNYANPVRRDVVSTGGPNDNVTIRFTTDNPGPWFFHCHIEFHLVAGLAAVFMEAPNELKQTAPPVAWGELCDKFEALPDSATAIEIVRL